MTTATEPQVAASPADDASSYITAQIWAVNGGGHVR